MARRARRQRGRQALCSAHPSRCTPSLPRHGRPGCCEHSSKKTLGESKLDTVGLEFSDGSTPELHATRSSHGAAVENEAQQTQNCEDSSRSVVDATEDRMDEGDDNCDDSDDVEEEDEEDREKARQAMLEKLACPRRRRCLLTGWVNRRVNEICNEDVDEPDSEDEAIRSALMDAIGAASANVETDLSTCTLDLLAYASDCQQAEAAPVSKLNFSSSTLTYVIQPETEGSLALVPTTGNACWTLDQVVETSLLDTPSAPLGKWREKPIPVGGGE